MDTKQTYNSNAGFTIIELSLVLIVLGILAASILPLIHNAHDDTMRNRDTTIMDTARDALLGYIKVNEGIPCVDAGGNPATTDCDAANTLDLLGVRTTDSRLRDFVFDVNDTLTIQEIANSGNSLCTALAQIINPAIPPATPPEPNVCASNNANTADTACAAASPMAFVMVGRGSDRCFNLENTHDSVVNDAVCPTAVADNRTFENPSRLHSRDSDDGYYEDLVYTFTPSELVEFMDCPAGGGGGTSFSFCDANETLVQVTNGNNSRMSLFGTSCYMVSEGTTTNLGCVPDATPIQLHSNSNCSNLITAQTALSFDANGDGRADVLCDNSSNCTSR